MGGGGHDSWRVSYVDLEVTGKAVVRAVRKRIRKTVQMGRCWVIEVTEEVLNRQVRIISSLTGDASLHN